MTELPMDMLSRRVAALENQHRRAIAVTTCLVAASAVLAVGTVLLAQPAQTPPLERVTAREIAIVDQSGKVRARLGAGPAGVSLVIGDSDGAPRIVIGTADNGDPQIGLLGKRNGFPRARLFQSGDNFQALSLEDERSSFINLVHTGRDVKLQAAAGVGSLGESTASFGVFASTEAAERTPGPGAQLVKDGKLVWREPAASGRGR